MRLPHKDIQTLYNNGYITTTCNKEIRIKEICIKDIQYAYNAFNNGMHVSTISFENCSTYDMPDEQNCDYAKFSDMLMEIRDLTIDDGSILDICDVVSLCKNIEVLKISSYWNMDEYSIDELLTSASNLKSVSIPSLNDDAVSTCNMIEDLDASHSHIMTCAPFAKTLKKLTASRTGIDDEGLALCTRLKILMVSEQYLITTCAPFAKTLKKLTASKSCIDDEGLALCTRLKILMVSNQPTITTCAPFAKTLKQLHADGATCGITDAGLQLCTRLRILNVTNNTKIASCIPFAKTLKTLHYRGSGICADQIRLCKKLRFKK